MKFNEYIQIVKNEYVTVQIVPAKSNRNNNTDAIAKIINKMYLKANQMIIRENKKLIITTQSKVSYYIHITKDTPMLLRQQQVEAKLTLLITQVVPLTPKENLNSNMAISKGVSKPHGNQEHGLLFGHYKMAGLQKLTFLKFLLLVTNTTIICITQTRAGIMNMVLPGITKNPLAVTKTTT